MSTTETEQAETQGTQDAMVKDDAVTYISPSPDYYVTRVKPTEQYINGEKRTTDPGLGYQFRNHEFTVRPGQDAVPTGPAGEVEDAVEFLDRQNPYWVRRETQIAPDASGVFLEVNRLGLLGKVDELHEMLDTERANWQREPVITAIEESLSLLEEPPPAA